VEQTGERPYHHGNLRRALIDAALQVIEAEGPAALSLRDLARRLGVSHAAPEYHFPDKAALLTAIAAEGSLRLATAMEEAGGDFLQVGLAYVQFVLEHPAHVRVMYEPSLYRTDDPEIEASRQRSYATLFAAAGRFWPEADPAQVGLAGWCLMHGVASLWLGGNLRQFAADPVALARWVAEVTFDATRKQS
jgi:AcrR family transcriptional regulator